MAQSQVWDAAHAAASPEPVGYTALDSLRIEKGYRYFGADLTSADTPFEAGVGFCVAKGKRPELDRSPAQRLRTLVVGGSEYLTVYGGEAVHLDGEVVGRVRSAAYGFTVERTVGACQFPGLDRGRDGGAGRRARRARACDRLGGCVVRPLRRTVCAPDHCNQVAVQPGCMCS